MKLIKEKARKIFNDGALLPEGATDQNFEDVWENIEKYADDLALSLEQENAIWGVIFYLSEEVLELIKEELNL